MDLLQEEKILNPKRRLERDGSAMMCRVKTCMHRRSILDGWGHELIVSHCSKPSMMHLSCREG